jgi:bla regulator protein BlaR1
MIPLNLHALLEDIPSSLTNHLWQSTLVALVIALLTLVLRRNYARTRFWLWFVAMDDQHLESILAHELSHVRRYDNLTAALHMLVEAVFWFHPLVWWLGTRLEQECDEHVLGLHHRPQIYAESILKVCEFCLDSPLPCTSGIHSAGLKQRLLQILSERTLTRLTLGKRLMLVTVGLAAVVVPVLTGAVTAAHRSVVAATRQVTAPPAPQAGVGGKQNPIATDANAAFLVATIRPSDPNSNQAGWGFPVEGHRLSCYNATVENILLIAYGIHIKQIVNAPEWVGKDRFDIAGVADIPGTLSLPQQQQMWRKLLADRFHLAFHREVRELPVYAITVAKGGPILKIADPGELTNTGNGGSASQRTLKFRSMSMSSFALNMNFYLDRPVIDRTSLPGNYDFTLQWTFDDAGLPEPNAAPSLFTAIKEQAGLELKAAKGPAEVLVIDHVDKPSEN